MLKCYFTLRQFRRTYWSFLVHSTTRNAPYVHPRLVSILELCQTFPNGFTHVKVLVVDRVRWVHKHYFILAIYLTISSTVSDVI